MKENKDAHSCISNAEYTTDGPQGSGTYCSECGAVVSLDTYDEYDDDDDFQFEDF